MTEESGLGKQGVPTIWERKVNEKKSIYEKRNKIEKQQQTQTYAQALSPKSTSAPQAICYQRYVHSVNPYAWLSHLYAIWFTVIDLVTVHTK